MQCVFEKTKINEKEVGVAPFFKKGHIIINYDLRVEIYEQFSSQSKSIVLNYDYRVLKELVTELQRFVYGRHFNRANSSYNYQPGGCGTFFTQNQTNPQPKMYR